ncbi:HAMP domain-containing protein [Paenalkalicoccus suaedae]|uniref:histidine kinase n=1 Tax=Paenalkalicoccus suaedae TaxID=2592382 RepID=A0A859FBN6_9BACI|nr:ATP-binding protein [Paenalkalicoccus suaedae]QKS69944.1 HAMP domain-containing protein [Paenalkalicoccus suaedae]
MSKPYISITKKMWLIFFSMSIVGIAFSFFTVYLLYDGLYLQSERDQLRAHADSLRQELAANGEEQVESLVNAYEQAFLEVSIVTDPMVLGAALPLLEPESAIAINDAEREQLLTGETIVLERDHVYFATDLVGAAAPYVVDGELTAVVFVYRPVSELQDQLVGLLPYVISLLVALILLLFVILRRIRATYVHPLLEMKDGASQISHGTYPTRFPPELNNEVGEVNRAFRRLAESLQEEDVKKREFLQNLSHELRTPLSYVKGYSELLLKEENESTRQIASVIAEESNRMHRLVEEIIDLTKLEGMTQDNVALEPLVMSEVVRQVMAHVRVKSEAKGQTLSYSAEEDLVIMGLPDRLFQACLNVIDNAIAYTQDGGTIDVILGRKDGEAALQVTDNGPGMDEADVERLTDRFYRGEKGRTRDKGGIGLGLAIVKQLVDLHHGRLEITSMPGVGTTVSIYIPEVLE